MAPIKASRQVLTSGVTNRITTRSKTTTLLNNLHQNITRNKRKAEGSPTKENDVKRSAFCDVTNSKFNLHDTKKIGTRKATVKSVLKGKQQNENLAPPPAPISKVQTRASLKNNTNVPNQTAQKPKETLKDIAVKKKTRLSNEFEKSGESLYSTALEDM